MMYSETLETKGITELQSYIARDSGARASSKASAPFQISFQTSFRLSQTTETGDETGGFLHELGMKQEDFGNFETNRCRHI